MAKADKSQGKVNTPIGLKIDSDRARALDAALMQIEKQFGKGAVMKLGANGTMQVDAIPTGSLGLTPDRYGGWTHIAILSDSED